MSNSGSDNTRERREYFRIKNKLFMSYEVLEQSLENNGEIDLSQKPSPRIQLLRDLNALERENEQYCKTLDDGQKSVAAFIFNNERKNSSTGTICSSNSRY